jgi:hypothetical protein
VTTDIRAMFQDKPTPTGQVLPSVVHMNRKITNSTFTSNKRLVVSTSHLGVMTILVESVRKAEGHGGSQEPMFSHLSPSFISYKLIALSHLAGRGVPSIITTVSKPNRLDYELRNPPYGVAAKS